MLTIAPSSLRICCVSTASIFPEEEASVYYRWIGSVCRRMCRTISSCESYLRGAGNGNFRSGAANYFRVAYQSRRAVPRRRLRGSQVRIQCAKCHNHPFERWKQQDYYGLAAFFARVARKGGPEFGEDQVYMQHNRRGDQSHTRRRSLPKFLGGDEPQIDPEADRRAALAGLVDARRTTSVSPVSLSIRSGQTVSGRGSWIL